MDIAVWVALASLVVNFVAVLLTNQRYAVKNAETRKEEMLKLERGMRDATETATRRYGETISAVREKVVQNELWNRDHFVDKATFNMVVSDIKESGRRLEEKIDRRFNETDRKLEKILNGRRDA